MMLPVSPFLNQPVRFCGQADFLFLTNYLYYLLLVKKLKYIVPCTS